MEVVYPLLPASPESVGIPSQSILRFIQSLEKQHISMHSYMIIRHGKVASQGYYLPFTPQRKHRMYSVTKNFTSVAIGFLEAEGKLSLSDRVVDYFKDKLPSQGVHPYIERMTIRDLLRMASPHEATTYKMVDTDDWLDSFFTYPPSHEPGTVFFYDTSASYTLCAIVERLSGQSLLDYLRGKFLNKIGFSEDAYCIKCPKGISHGGSGLICTTSDMARFALACMDSVTGKNEIIPHDYIKAATSKQIDTFIAKHTTEDWEGYGYQFWRTLNNGFACRGMGGQLAICLPDKDFVLLTTADTQPMPDGNSAIFGALWDELYPYLSDTALTEDEQAKLLQQELATKSSSLKMQPLSGVKAENITQRMTDRTFKMQEGNALNLNAVRLEVNGDEGKLILTKGEKEHIIPFGFGKHVNHPFPECGYDCISSAAWQGTGTLLILSNIIDDYVGTVKINVTVKGDTITLHMKKAAELFVEDYNGFASGEIIS